VAGAGGRSKVKVYLAARLNGNNEHFNCHVMMSAIPWCFCGVERETLVRDGGHNVKDLHVLSSIVHQGCHSQGRMQRKKSRFVEGYPQIGTEMLSWLL